MAHSPFRYDPALVERFPSVVGGVSVATVINGPTPPALADAVGTEIAAARHLRLRSRASTKARRSG